jgi:hypothetical protein
MGDTVTEIPKFSTKELIRQGYRPAHARYLGEAIENRNKPEPAPDTNHVRAWFKAQGKPLGRGRTPQWAIDEYILAMAVAPQTLGV